MPDNKTIREALSLVMPETGVLLNELQIERLCAYYELLVEGNRQFNLTRILSPMDVAVKHYADSFLCYRPEFFPPNCRLADVGSGAGFPGVPLAILRPDMEVVLFDSLRKRTDFLTAAAATLGLGNVKAVQIRAEDAGRNREFRESFHVVTARAVAPLAVLAELCLPLVRLRGWFIALKGPRGELEVSQAEAAIRKLGGIVPESLEKFQLPVYEEARTVVRIEKIRLTPALYPRRAGIPEKQPLQ